MKILKYLHASDFQLHVPVTCWNSPRNAAPGGVSGSESGSENGDGALPLERVSARSFGAFFPEVPRVLAEECMAAAWESAKRVFDLALAQNVDFMLLTGDILDPNLTGARGIVFLAEQFRRLHAHGISVYWKLERSLEAWMLPDFRFPENVFLFPSNETHIKKFRLPDSSKNIFIASWNGSTPDFGKYDFSHLPGNKLPFSQTLALCESAESLNFARYTGENSAQEAVSFSEGPEFSASYVALTSVKARTTAAFSFSEEEKAVLHAPGPIQRRTPDAMERGNSLPAGVSVIRQDLDGEKPLSVQFFPTETLGWKSLEKTVPETVTDVRSFEAWLEQSLKKEFPGIPAAESLSENMSERLSKSSSNNTSKTAPEVLSETLSGAEKNRASENAAKPLSETAALKGEVPSCSRTFVFWRLNAVRPEPQRVLRTLFLEGISGEKKNGKRAESRSENAAEKTSERNAMKKNAAEIQKSVAEILKNARKFGENLPERPWSVTIQAVREGLLPYEWSQSGAMLGDFLRLIQYHETNPDAEKEQNDAFAPHTLSLTEYLSAAQRESLLAVVSCLESDEKEKLLKDAAILGASALFEAQEGDRR